MITPVTDFQRSTNKVQFGLFEADLATGELRRSGVRIRLQAQPFRVLSFLLERPGEIVTREEIQQRVWGADTIVDFDHSLGTAINKIREALGDSAENPRFIETLARRGYRFIAPIKIARTEAMATAAADAAPVLVAAKPSPEPAPVPLTAAPLKRMVTRSWMVWGAAALILAFATFYIGVRSSEPSLAPRRISQVTFSGRVSPGNLQFESLPATATDGSRIYFPQIENGRAMLAESLIADGETSTLGVPGEIAAPSLGDISPDGSKLLLRNHLATEPEQAFWIVPTIGGAARQISGVLAHDATWMPDGQRILFATGHDLFVAREDGSEEQKFAIVPGRAFWLRWSPDGSRLRFTVSDSQTHTTSLWEMNSTGRELHQMLPDWNHPAAECCGSWTADGRYFVFQSTREGESNLWQMDEKPGFLGRSGPEQITNGPLSYQAPITAHSGDQIFFVGLNTRSELLSYDERINVFVPYAGTLSNARRVEFSRDGRWVAWIKQDDNSLWRSRLDGSERVQLTARPLEVFMMHWSPDDKQIVLMGLEPGKTWKLYSVDAEGGQLKALLNEDRNQADPDWSPDGTHIVFGRLPELMAKESSAKTISVLDLASGRLGTLAGSEGLISPRWSPDGRSIAALSLDQSRLMLFDTLSKQWRVLAQQTIADPVWSHDSKAIFFHDFGEDGEPIYKLTIADDHIRRIADLRDLRSGDFVDYRFAGLAPGDIPLVNARMSTANIYSTAIGGR
jgi:Tol biopolymer transport system component/DNA-binding winged helix-turn-helix (wHTH) protein